MRKYYFVILLFLFPICNLVFSQEIHFSQFYQTPFQLNPSLTGINACKFRAGGSYRDQWRSISKPVQTYTFFGEAKITLKKLKYNWFGIGFQMYGDKAGTSQLGGNDSRLTIAYHQGFDKDFKFTVSLGMYLGMVTRSIKFNSLYFGNQWNGSYFDLLFYSNQEPYRSLITSYFDIGCGGALTYFNNDNFKLNIGGGIAHINSPEYTFYGNNNKLDYRKFIHTSFSFLNKSTLFYPKIYVSKQDKTYEFITGMNLSNVKSKIPYYYGIWYRWNRDIVPVIGFDINEFLLMFSYDFNISRLNAASRGLGGFEIFLEKRFLCSGSSGKQSEKHKAIILNCPIF